jgi:hypothetical protein
VLNDAKSNEWRQAMKDREREFIMTKREFIVSISTAVLVAGFVLTVTGFILAHPLKP